jgi:hypothetical protein
MVIIIGAGLKKKILVYSIIRDEERFLDRYYNQLKDMVSEFTDYDFYLSLYENDSKDKTLKILKSKDWSFFKEFSLISEKLGTPAFGAVMAEERVKNLSTARNKAIGAKDFLFNADYVMMIESDMRFDNDVIRQILEFETVEPEFDIVSGITIRENGQLYDSWATRLKAKFISHKHSKGLDFETLPYDKYYSTSNGVCLYRAEPFREGARYGWINTLTRQPDCDTVVVCQEFHKRGYKNIYIIHTAKIYHEFA